MKATLLREIDRAQLSVMQLRGELRRARRRAHDRCEHLAAAVAQTETLKTQLETLSALAARMKE